MCKYLWDWNFYNIISRIWAFFLQETLLNHFRPIYPTVSFLVLCLLKHIWDQMGELWRYWSSLEWGVSSLVWIQSALWPTLLIYCLSLSYWRSGRFLAQVSLATLKTNLHNCFIQWWYSFLFWVSAFAIIHFHIWVRLFF